MVAHIKLRTVSAGNSNDPDSLELMFNLTKEFFEELKLPTGRNEMLAGHVLAFEFLGEREGYLRIRASVSDRIYGAGRITFPVWSMDPNRNSFKRHTARAKFRDNRPIVDVPVWQMIEVDFLGHDPVKHTTDLGLQLPPCLHQPRHTEAVLVRARMLVASGEIKDPILRRLVAACN